MKKDAKDQAPVVTNRDLIALLGNALLDTGAGIPSAKAYALAGRLYNQFDYIPAEKAIQALAKKQGKVSDPISYLFAVAKKVSEKMKGDAAAVSNENSSRQQNSKLCNNLLARRIGELASVRQSAALYLGLPVQGGVPENFKKFAR